MKLIWCFTPTCQGKLGIPEFTLAPVSQQLVISRRQALKKAGKDKASKDTQVFLGKKLLLKASSQLQGGRKTCSPLPSHPASEGWIQNQARLPSTAFSKSPTASPPRGEEDESLGCLKAIRPPWILIIGLLFTICPNTEDIKMSACRAHPMQRTFLTGISGFFYKQLYVTHLVSVAVHSSAARLNISTRHSSGESSRRQQKRSIMEMCKQWLSFRTLSFSCPSSYCSTRELSYTNTIANVKANDASHKTQQ